MMMMMMMMIHHDEGDHDDADDADGDGDENDHADHAEGHDSVMNLILLAQKKMTIMTMTMMVVTAMETNCHVGDDCGDGGDETASSAECNNGDTYSHAPPCCNMPAQHFSQSNYLQTIFTAGTS